MSQEQTKDMSQYFYRASAADFMKIPGSPVAYWASDKERLLFKDLKPIGSFAEARQGMATSDNNRFLRYWFEVDDRDTNYSAESREKAKISKKKWFPYNKGGSFRKWWGNQDYLINWENDGQELLDYAAKLYGSPTRTIKSMSHYFRPSVGWSFVSSSYFGVRVYPKGFLFDVGGSSVFPDENRLKQVAGYLCSGLAPALMKTLNPTLNFQVGNIEQLPFKETNGVDKLVEELINISKLDWDESETSWEFSAHPLFRSRASSLEFIVHSYLKECRERVAQALVRERDLNQKIYENYGLSYSSDQVSEDQITLSCNDIYEYGEENVQRRKSETLQSLLSYSVGCMMGRYSIDKPGLVLASQGEALQDYLCQVPSPRFMPDDDAILPLTDQEWFADDATNRFREFVRVVWGDDHLQENLDFIAESLCLHAIKAKRGESALDTIRRYLSTQFYKDHMRTYKKRPIYWLFSSGKQKAFECLVYLHRYNEGTLARMRTEYVIPLTAKLTAYADKLEQDKAASASAAETKRLEKEINTLHKQQAELAEFDEKLRHYADQRIALDLDNGVKVNYGKFGDLLAEVKAITGEKPE